MNYQRLPEFTTRHELIIKNQDGENWKAVEVLAVRKADFSDFSPTAFRIEGKSWQGENSVLLGGGGSLVVTEMYKSGVEVRLRTGPDAGTAAIFWDGQPQKINLYSQHNDAITVNLDGYSWGQLSHGRAVLVYAARAADFLTFFFLMMALLGLFIAAYFRSQPASQIRLERNIQLSWQDWLALGFFLAVAIILTVNQAAGSFYRYTSLSGDAGNYASFAAALRFPELFTRDPLLSDPSRFGFFATFHIPWMNLVYPIFGNFGTSFFTLVLPTIFLQLTGFYLLGRHIFQSRIFGLLLTGLCFVFFEINLSEFWGFVASPIARFSFQAVLPFVLLLVLVKGRNPRWWPLLMALTGGLVYVHAVSAPAWSVAIALALWFMPGNEKKWKEKIKWAALALLVFIVVLIPFAQDYFGNTQFGEVDAQDLTVVQNIIRYRHADGMIDIATAIDGFFRIAIASSWVNVAFFTLAYASLLGMLWLHFEKGDIPIAIIAACFLAGLLSVSLLFPMIDFSIARLLDRNPLQIQFLRTLRNYFPLMFICLLSPLAYMYTKNPANRMVRITSVFVGFMLLGLWNWQTGFAKVPVIDKTIRCWMEGRLICPIPEHDERADFFEAVKNITSPGESVLSEDLAIRYYSLRPLAFLKKDGATFAFSDHASLLTWYPKSLRYDEIAKLRDDKPAFAFAYWQFGLDLGADYVVLDSEGFNAIEEQLPREALVFQNSVFSLLKTR